MIWLQITFRGGLQLNKIAYEFSLYNIVFLSTSRLKQQINRCRTLIQVQAVVARTNYLINLVYELALELIIMIKALHTQLMHQLGRSCLQNNIWSREKSLVNKIVYGVLQSQNSYSPQLDMYQAFLTKHQLSIKKPHPRLQSEEQRIVSKYIADKRFSSLVTFLFNNADKALAHQHTASNIDAALTQNWACLSSQQKVFAAYSLSCLRETKVFSLFKSQLLQKLDQFGIQAIDPQELIIYLIGQLINRKSASFIDDLVSRQKSNFDNSHPSEKLRLILNVLEKANYSGTFIRQYKQLQQYLSLLLDPTLNSLTEKDMNHRNRSRLQIQVQSLLISMQLHIKRQININGYKVDFLISKNQQHNESNQPRRQIYLLQVNGSYHYTLTGLTKGKQIIRNLIVGQYAPLRILHFQDYLSSKGNRNKMAHISDLLRQECGVNWQRRGSGTNSEWQVTVDETIMKQFV